MTGGDKEAVLALLTVTLFSAFAMDGSDPFVFITGIFCACASMNAARKTVPNAIFPFALRKAAEVANGILSFIASFMFVQCPPRPFADMRTNKSYTDTTDYTWDKCLHKMYILE